MQHWLLPEESLVISEFVWPFLSWICPSVLHRAGCVRLNKDLFAFIQVFLADLLQLNTSIRANQRFSKPPCLPAGTSFFFFFLLFLFRFLRIMTHAPCFQVKALHSLYTLSPVPSSCKSLPEMEPSGGQELQGRRVWRGGCSRGSAQHPCVFWSQAFRSSKALQICA